MLKAKYYDSPDGQDFSGKLAATNKYAVSFPFLILVLRDI